MVQLASKRLPANPDFVPERSMPVRSVPSGRYYKLEKLGPFITTKDLGFVARAIAIMIFGDGKELFAGPIRTGFFSKSTGTGRITFSANSLV